MANRVTPARRAALQVMRAVRRGGLADAALEAAYARVAVQERAWLQELSYGTLRLRGRIDYILEELVHRGTGSLHHDLLDILRLALYQLLEMRSVPDYAAVSQAVEQAKAAAGAGAGRLANGVLQGFRRRLDGQPRDGTALLDLFPDPESEPIDFLSSWGSHPRWLIERWFANFGGEATSILVDANNRRPELYLRPIGQSVPEALAQLGAEGLEAEPVPIAPEALRLTSSARLLDALAAVPAIVQDPAAGLVLRYAAVPPGSQIADLCAAPGGKAIGLADGARYIAAADLGLARLGRLRENLERLEGLPLGIVVADARFPPFRPVDAVLIDVPCTGTGTLRRHPDGRWRIGPRDLDSLVVLQREIFDAAAGVVRPGGLLIYSTCSLEPEENEDQVTAFLERHPEFSIEPPEPGLLAETLLDPQGQLTVLPWMHGVDGAFAARLRRDG